jgi:thiamine biosynthesis lipoprotein
MATQFEVVFPFDTPNALHASGAALDLIDQLEGQLSVYRETSEVSNINRRAATEAVVVEPRLFDLLTTAEWLARETDGAFDITAGALVKAWGFFRGPPRVPGDDDRQAALAASGVRHLQLDPARRTVRFLRPGVEINLGSIGKGYALDRAAEVLWNDWAVRSAVLHGGGSSVYALGSPPGGDRGWPVGIGHPWRPGERLALLHLRDRALGTSAATFKHLVHEGRKLGHLLDPRTGWPGAGIASASALAPTAAEADALATAFYLLGLEGTRRFCATHPGVGAVLLPDGASEPVVLGLSGE